MKYRPGDYIMICQRTGNRYYRSEMVKESRTGLWVHKSVYNPEHPQDHVRSIPDKQSVPHASPDTEKVMGEATIVDFCNCS